MALPFLMKPKVSSTTIVEHRKPDETVGEDSPDSNDEGLNSAASDLIDAVHSRDVKGAAAAMRAAFELMESQPHEEINHDEDEQEG
jgi:DNA-binding GntR family transcriptional regulator